MRTAGDILFKVNDGKSTARSVVYITTKWDSDMAAGSSKLPYTVQSSGGAGGGGMGGDGKWGGVKNDYTNSMSWKVSESVYNVMYNKYAAELNSACNIYTPEEQDHTRCRCALGTLVLCARSGVHSALSAQ